MDFARLSALDRAHVWHPYTRHDAAREGLPLLVRGEGIHLLDAAGRRYVDAISSWWCCALGHGHPRVVEAIRRQASVLQHSILGNLAHPGAAELAARLARLMPTPDRHVLFASDGASAVEQALKIAVQHAHNTGRPARTRFAALEGAYHGDTFGAMALGYLEAFHRPFRSLLMPVDRLPFPACSARPAAPGAPADGGPDCPCFGAARSVLDTHAEAYAAVLVEPLCLGAAGMRTYPACWLRSLAAWCRAADVPLIVDEIAMGFGRTGRMFAFEHAGIDPDLVCVGKALAAGYLPISATIVRDAIYESFDGGRAPRTLQHGHTFCGNPIAAAAALAALDEYEHPDFLPAVRGKAALLAARLAPMADEPGVASVRALGLMGAVELRPAPADAARPARLRAELLAAGLLARPLGDVAYLMPPLVISDADLAALADTFCGVLRRTLSGG